MSAGIEICERTASRIFPDAPGLFTRTRARLLVSLLFICSAAAADNNWLYGTWWYASADGQYLEGDDKDGMVFKPDGTVDLVDENAKPWLTCSYHFRTAIQINLDCVWRERPRQLRFLINEDRTQIANVEDTDNGFYRR